MPPVLCQIHEVSGSSDWSFEYYLKNSENWKFDEWFHIVTLFMYSDDKA